MGLILAALVAAAVWLALWRARLSRAALQLAGAALLAGLAGYTLQGRSGLTGSPASQRPPAALPPVMPIDLASEFFGRFNAAYPWLTIANSYNARGNSAGAVATLTSALKASSQDAELWIALGNALIIHNGGRPSPASELAYRRGIASAPDHPGPLFFYGLALLGRGEPDGALELWRGALRMAHADSPWRDNLVRRIALVERLQASRRDAPAQEGASR